MSSQLVGNVGLFYVCYELSKRGWNCLPTSRNVKGIDIVIYNEDASITHTLQVKPLSKRNAVPFGSNKNLMAEFLIVCLLTDPPTLWCLTKQEGLDSLSLYEKEGRKSWWINQPDLVNKSQSLDLLR